MLTVFTDPLAPLRQPRVPPDASQQVEFTLPVTAQVDGARRDVDVHEVVDDPALDVALDPVHQVPAAHIEDLDVGQPPSTHYKSEPTSMLISSFKINSSTR